MRGEIVFAPIGRLEPRSRKPRAELRHLSDSRKISLYRGTITDGVERSIDEALTAVFNYWSVELGKLGVGPFKPRNLPESPGSRFVPRHEAQQHALEIVKGLAWQQLYQFLKFNDSKGFAEPIDLSNANVTWSLYKAAYNIDFVVKSPDDGEEIRLTLQLDDADAQAMAALESDAEHNALSQEIILRKKSEIESRLAEALKARAGKAAFKE